MKKIINGRIYDTAKAVLIGEVSGSSAYMPDSLEAALYRTPRSGRYFVAGSGGPMSRFAQSTGQNNWSGGSDIIPMSAQDALEWAEQNLSTEQIEQHFGDMIEEA